MDYSSLKVVRSLSQSKESQVLLLQGHAYTLLVKYSSLERVMHEVKVLRLLVGAGGAPLVLATKMEPFFPWLPSPGRSYYFYMSDRGSVDLHHLALGHLLDPHEALRIVLDIARCLAEVHGRGVVHNNVHPTNVVLRVDPVCCCPTHESLGQLAVSLVNYSLSRRKGERAKTEWIQESQRMYLAPEVLRGEPSQFAADVFSLGKLLEWLMLPHWGAHKDLTRLISGMTDCQSQQRLSLPQVIDSLEILVKNKMPQLSFGVPEMTRWMKACVPTDRHSKISSSTTGKNTK